VIKIEKNKIIWLFIRILIKGKIIKKHFMRIMCINCKCTTMYYNIRQRVTMPMKTREFEKILQKNGFEAIRQSGSHRTYYNSDTRKQLVVPIHAGEMPKGLLSKMMKQAGLE